MNDDVKFSLGASGILAVLLLLLLHAFGAREGDFMDACSNHKAKPTCAAEWDAFMHQYDEAPLAQGVK